MPFGIFKFIYIIYRSNRAVANAAAISYGCIGKDIIKTAGRVPHLVLLFPKGRALSAVEIAF